MHHRIKFVITFIFLVTVQLNLNEAWGIVSQEWAQRIFNPRHTEEYPSRIAVDNAGNIYIAGMGCSETSDDDYMVIKLAPDGSRLWTAFHDENGGYDIINDMVLDEAGNCYVTGRCRGVAGTTDWDFGTAKFNSNGEIMWFATYDMSNCRDYATAIAIDDEKNVYVTGPAGATSYPYSGYDFITVKYDSSGIEQWIAQSGTADVKEVPIDVSVDGDGNVYVTGCRGTSGLMDYLTCKYDSQGNTIWEVRNQNEYNIFDTPCGLVLDEEANVYVSGSTGFSAPPWNFLTIKYNTDGDVLWQDEYTCYGEWEAKDMALDMDSNLIVAGMGLTLSNDYCFVTLKYSPSGDLLWAEKTAGSTQYLDSNNIGLAVDSADNCFITGTTFSIDWFTQTPECCYSFKYDTNGNLIWTAAYEYELTNDAETHGIDIAHDQWGNVMVVSSFFFCGCGEDHDILAIRYHEEPGDMVVGIVPNQWPVQIPAGGGEFNYHLMTINSVSDNLTTDYWWQVNLPNGRSRTIGTEQMVLSFDTTAIAMSQNVPAPAEAGTYQYMVFVGQFPGIVWASDTLTVIKLSGDGGNNTGGWNYSLDLAKDKTAEFYASSVPETPDLITISPNPFNPTTTISYALPEAGKVNLQVYDITGRQVATLVNGFRNAGIHNVQFDAHGLASGIYIYRLTAGSFNATGKLVLMK